MHRRLPTRPAIGRNDWSSKCSNGVENESFHYYRHRTRRINDPCRNIHRGARRRLQHYFPALEAISHRKGAQFSSGEQQVLALARGVAARPSPMLHR